MCCSAGLSLIFAVCNSLHGYPATHDLLLADEGAREQAYVPLVVALSNIGQCNVRACFSVAALSYVVMKYSKGLNCAQLIFLAWRRPWLTGVNPTASPPLPCWSDSSSGMSCTKRSVVYLLCPNLFAYFLEPKLCLPKLMYVVSLVTCDYS